ncbi:MAG: rhodanese-like domain-containing protein [Candidatus Dormibacteraceae bacterium]
MSTAEETPFRRVQLDEAKRLMDEGYQVVDVREDWEWNKGHIPGARHVVLNSIIGNPGEQGFSDRTIFVCAVGERSAVASEMAVALGVKNVVNLDGGTNAWKAAGLRLETP